MDNRNKGKWEGIKEGKLINQKAESAYGYYHEYRSSIRKPIQVMHSILNDKNRTSCINTCVYM